MKRAIAGCWMAGIAAGWASAALPTAPPAPRSAQTQKLDERRVVPGTRVWLAPPAGHAPGNGYFGYQWADLGASLIVAELRAPSAEMVAGFDAENLAKQGMTLLEATDAKFGQHKGKLIHATQRANGALYEKWLAVFGDEKRTVLITVNLPDALDDELAAQFKAAVLGAVWDPTLQVDPFAVLPWTITQPQGLAFATNIGPTLLFTEDGEPVQKDKPASARLLVGPSAGEAKIADARKFAESRVRKLPGMAGLELESSVEFSAGGRTGWEIVARATDRDSGQELLLHQVLLVGQSDYVLFVGQCAREQRDTWLPRFQACAASWKLKPPPEQK